MKNKKFYSLILAAAAVVTLVAAGEKYETLSIGSKAPKDDVKMADISGKKLSLTDMKQDKGLLVIFSCNTCPFVLAWEDRYPGLGELCKKNNLGMVLLNSNEARRAGDDSMEKMKNHAEEKNYNCYYMVDEKSELANAFGAKTTPHVFLFDKNLKLVYRGAIDDSGGKEVEPKELYLKDAIESLSAGKKIKTEETKSVGCSIKRVS
jgi:thioredoxin-related protein